MKKWIAGAVAAVVAVGAVIALILGSIGMSIAGGVVSMGAGGLGAIFGDKELQRDYGYFGCAPGGTLGVPVTGSSEDYIRTTIGVAKSMGIDEKGQIIAVMTMAQESMFYNYANDGASVDPFTRIWPAPGRAFWNETAALSLKYPHDRVGNNGDSVGLYQQRASMGWANDPGFQATSNPDEAIRRLLDPRWQAQAFYGGPGGPQNPGLLDVPNWQSKRPGDVAQIVQGSAHPDEYHKWEADATALVRANQDAPALPLFGGGEVVQPGTTEPSGSTQTGTPVSNETSTTSDVQYPLAEGTYRISSPYGSRNDPFSGARKSHRAVDFAGEMYTPIYAIADGEVVRVGWDPDGYGNWVVVNHNIDGTIYSSLYAHMEGDGVYVSLGQQVKKGQKIAAIGTAGNSTGPHLHLEIWEGGRFSGGTNIDPIPFLGGNHTVGGGSTTLSACTGDDSTVLTGANGVQGSFDGDASGMLNAFQSIVGNPYSWGGGTLEGPSEGILYAGIDGRGIIGFDCSSAVRYAIYHGTNKQVTLPRTSSQQYAATAGKTVWRPGDDTSGIQPGDLLFYGSSTSNIVHVAMYIGNGQMFEAPKPGGFVQKTALRTGSMVAATRL